MRGRGDEEDVGVLDHNASIRAIAAHHPHQKNRVETVNRRDKNQLRPSPPEIVHDAIEDGFL